jgi:hypothetical protein
MPAIIAVVDHIISTNIIIIPFASIGMPMVRIVWGIRPNAKLSDAGRDG